MTFSASNLSMLVTANAFQLWQYKSSADALATIMGANYFDNAADELRVGDLIVVRDSGNLTSLIRVVSNDGTTVVVARDAAYEKQAALTTADAVTIDATYDASEQTTMINMRTRINEIETALKAVKILT
ncbi:hypothetical protein LCGC14_2684000 [marine sediment metagenome]|uniref:Uncharacterized protein n=1 Tax=marine sediment metagenome TaxID=412755 RepID=A0A0F8ZKF9_9ZZZZ